MCVCVCVSFFLLQIYIVLQRNVIAARRTNDGAFILITTVLLHLIALQQIQI